MKRLLTLIFVLLLALPATADDFRKGLGAVQDGDYEEATATFRRLAESGDRNSQFMLGVMYEGGYGLAKDPAQALIWFEKSATLGLASAQYNTGIYYQFGRGVKADPATAARWHGLAAAQGHASVQNNLASLYFMGQGIAKDPIEAWKWFDLAARRLDGKSKTVALENRAKVEKTLDADEIAAAKRRVADWRPVDR